MSSSLFNPICILLSLLLYKNPDVNKYRPIVDDENTISILTLNTWALPIPYGKSSKSTRHQNIVEAINSNGADIICLQEVFNRGLRKKIASNIPLKYGYHTDLNCERKVLKFINMDCQGGLVTLSKHPIIAQSFIPFPIEKKYSAIESAGRKGILFTTIQLENRKINVINTHLYAGSSPISEQCRFRQYLFIDSIIKAHHEWQDYPIFIAGDLNIQHPMVSHINKEPYSKVYSSLVKKQWIDSRKDYSNLEYTYDPKINFYADKKEKRQILDYIFFHSKEKNIRCKNQYIIYTGDQSISDHNGFVAQFQVHPNPEPLPHQKEWATLSNINQVK